MLIEKCPNCGSIAIVMTHVMTDKPIKKYAECMDCQWRSEKARTVHGAWKNWNRLAKEHRLKHQKG